MFPSKKKYGAGQLRTHLYRNIAKQHADSTLSSSKKVAQSLGQVFSLHPAELKSYGILNFCYDGDCEKLVIKPSPIWGAK